MLYKIIRIWVRLGLLFFCRKISFTDRAVLKSKGPLLLACNHPNSFLDAIIVGSHFDRPVHFLARGDVFRKPLAKKILSALKMIPIYRLTEGREYLALNDATFEYCGDILGNGGIILIFAEGLCMNQWALRPLKKGAARIAWTAFNNPVIRQQFRVIPVGINYNGFDKKGKRVIVHFEKAITFVPFAGIHSSGDFIQQFNDLLQVSLQNAILSGQNFAGITQFLISNCNHADNNMNIIEDLKRRQQNAVETMLPQVVQQLAPPRLISATPMHFTCNVLAYVILVLPAITGWLLHIFLLYPLDKLVRKKTSGTVFYDSVMFGGLLVSYPVYFIFINIVSMLFVHSILIHTIVFIAPFFAAIYLTWMDCAGRIGNYLMLSPDQRKLLTNALSN